MTRPLPFTKMQGAGNDFIVLDARGGLPEGSLSPETLTRLCDRRFGIGADQVLVLDLPSDPRAAFDYRIFNADGSEVQQCGNGARCFARYVFDRGLAQGDQIVVNTRAGLITPRRSLGQDIAVDMGPPQLSADRLPFRVDGLDRLPVARAGHQGYALTGPDGRAWPVWPVSMGNPHLVFFVDDLDQAPVAELGSWLQAHDRLPERVNAGFVQVVSPEEIRLRVYERGSGETLACGTGACAAVVAGMTTGRLTMGLKVRVQTRGGLLAIEWSGQPADAVILHGPAVTVFEGILQL